MRNLIQSLSTQLALIISLALSVLTVLSGVLIERHLARAIEQQELDNLDQQASVLMSTLMTLMMDGNGTLARDWLENLHGASGLVEAEVLGNDGQIAFRDTGTLQKVNAYLGHDRFTRKAESLHFSLNWVTTDSITQALAGEKVYQYSNDKRVLSIVLPILQQNECKTCHGYDTASLRGALLVSVSTDAANARIADMQHTLWILAIVLVLMLGILLWIVLRTGVLQPIARLRDGILRVAKGDRNVVLAAIRAD